MTLNEGWSQVLTDGAIDGFVLGAFDGLALGLKVGRACTKRKIPLVA